MAAKVHAQNEKEMETFIKEAEFALAEKQQGFHFDEENHIYYLDGKRMYGTTNVLSVVAKPALIQWAANMACDYILEHSQIKDIDEVGIPYTFTTERVIDEARVAHTKKKESAGEKGTLVHSLIEGVIKSAISLNNGKLAEYAILDTAPAQVREFVQWAIVNDVKFLASEIRLYSKKLFVAGTADFICEKAGKLYIGDIKTSSAIYDEHFWQASAYAHMAREMGLYQDFHGVVIVNIPRHGGIKVQESYDLKGNFNIFKAAVTIFKGKEARKVKKLKK